MSRKLQLEQAYRAAVEEISNLCRTNSYAVPNLVAVSKYKPAEDIRVLYDLGHRDFGENYVQELQQKAVQLPKDIKWHFIGNLQSNKAKLAREIPNLAFVETLDSTSKATKLDNQRGQLSAPSPLGVYIQINTSEEAQKAGIFASNLNEIESLAKHILERCPNLKFTGLMTIGSYEQSHGKAENQDFRRLSDIREKISRNLGVPTQSLGLSMGMSADYVQAIKQGSTNVRIGSNIFGGRVSKEDISRSS